MTDRPRIHIAKRDPASPEERKTLDELMLEVAFEVRELRSDFDDLRTVVEKREPFPRSAAWLAVVALLVIAVGITWERVEQATGVGTTVHVTRQRD